MHWLLPTAATAASAAFAVAVLRQYAARRRTHQLAWGVGLAMFALASLALTTGVAAGWTPFGFKVYYLFGAMLNVPWLALGTVSLLAGPLARRAYLAGLLLFTAASTVLLALAGVFGATQESLLATPPKVENRIRSPFNAVCSALAANGHEPAECRGRRPGGSRG